MTVRLEFVGDVTLNGQELTWNLANTGDELAPADMQGANVIVDRVDDDPTPKHYEALTLGAEVWPTDTTQMFTYLPTLYDGGYHVDITAAPLLDSPQVWRCHVTIRDGASEVMSSYRLQ